MSDLISRQAAINALTEELAYKPEGYWDSGLNQYDVEVVLNQQPSIDAVEVRHGHWDTVEDWDGDEHYQCSECGAEFVLIDGTPQDNDYLYCPHCGARLDGEQNED